MGNVFPPNDLTIESLMVIRLSSLSGRNTITHPFDLVQIRRGLGSESLHTHLVSFQIALPNIRKSTRSVRDCITQRHPVRVIRFRKDPV